MGNIAIIGGGYTGLTAAYRLAKKGYKVKIYEKSSTLGGLAGGFNLKINKKEYPLERAYHALFRTDSEIIDLVKELGIADKLKFYKSSIAIYYNDKAYPFTTPLDLLRFSPLSFLNRIRAGLVVLYLQHKSNWKKFRNITAYEWMQKWTGKQVSEVIWKPLLKGKFHKYFDKVAMSWLWARVHTRASSRNKAHEELGYFDGGFQVFTDALISKLKSMDVAIEVNSDIKSIENQEKVSPKIVTAEKVEIFDKVLATVPSYVFANLVKNYNQITKSYIDLLNSVDYLGAIIMIFTSKQEISPYYWHNVNTKSPFLVFLNHTALVGNKMYDGNYIYYLGTYVPNDHKYFETDDKEIMNEWIKALKGMFPQLEVENLESKYIFKYRNAQHIVDLNYEARIPDYKTPIENVYLANFTQIYPEDRGTNFAVKEGNKIAELIDSDFI